MTTIESFRLDPKLNNSWLSVGPDELEMARRHRAKAKHFLYVAEKYGDTPKGRAAAEEAVSYIRIAQGFEARAAEIRHIRDYGRTA